MLRLVARMILELHKNPEYLGFLRMVVADSRQFPWIAGEVRRRHGPQTERLTRYLAHLTAMGVLDCRNPMLAAHQFMGTAQRVLSVALDDESGRPARLGRRIVEETVRMFLQHYRQTRSNGASDAGQQRPR